MSHDKHDNDAQAPRTQRGGHTPQQWHDLVDEKIRAAQEEGQFDNLANAGKSIDLDDNPYAGDRRMAYSFLKSHGLAPREIELGKQIDAELARAESVLTKLRRQCDTLRADMRTPLARKREAYALLRQQSAARYEAILREIRSNTLSLNIIAPPALHRRPVDVTERMRAFDTEFAKEW